MGMERRFLLPDDCSDSQKISCEPQAGFRTIRNENLEAELLGHWQNANAFAKMIFLMNVNIQRKILSAKSLSLLVP
jgi:hypothetical protein